MELFIGFALISVAPDAHVVKYAPTGFSKE